MDTDDIAHFGNDPFEHLIPVCNLREIPGEFYSIYFIFVLDIIEKIYQHPGLWKNRNHDLPEPLQSLCPSIVSAFE